MHHPALAAAPADRLLHRPYAVTPAQVARYQSEGFIKLKDVLDGPTLAEYGVEIARLVEEFAFTALPLEQRTTYGKAFLQVMNLWRRSAVVEAFVRSRRIAGIAADLMECDRVRLYHDQALSKEAGGGYTPWHADQQYWPLATDRTITAWIPLQATPLEMGPLSFAGGSQRILSGRDLEISDTSEKAIGLTLRDCAVEESAYDLGEVSFHAGWTFHRAGPNRTGRIRHVMTMIYYDGDARVAAPQNANQAKDLADWLPGCIPGGPAASPINPLLFERG